MTSDVTATGLDVAKLVEMHQAGIWRYLRALGCESSEAEDLTQDTFLEVLQKPFHDYNREATAGYLRKVARNLFITAKRRQTIQFAMGELNEIDVAWSRWAGNDGGEVLLMALESCFQRLAERARQALELRFREKRCRADIAEAVGLSEHGTKNLMQRAKQKLRECSERQMQ